MGTPRCYKVEMTICDARVLKDILDGFRMVLGWFFETNASYGSSPGCGYIAAQLDFRKT
jgi:hypothetical protein